MRRNLLIHFAILMATGLFAQVPEKMSYQAVVRDAANRLVTNSNIGMEISIIQGSITGAAVYIETHFPTTNANGLVSIEIGTGNVISGSFSNINWANGPYFLQSETDPTGGTNFNIIGISQLLSVPYALYAQTSGSSMPGPQGPQGIPGNDGPIGPPGPIGLTGPAGPQGIPGVQGNVGPMGPQGPIGLTGPTGQTGQQGPIGLTGPTGPQGIPGNDGPIGPQGPIGLTGATGAQGWQGPIGPSGPIGPQGVQGPIGLTGPQGIQGPQGNDGQSGVSIAGANITITGNGTASVPYVISATNTDNQQLSVSTTGDTLRLQNGGFVIIPGISAANTGGGSSGPTFPIDTVNCFGISTVVVDVTNPTTGKTWMDRNLGASRAATSSKDINAYGDLYQWGRAADGHQCRNSTTRITLSSTDQPGHGDFIVNWGVSLDWRSPENSNLWQGVNGTNNPCPSGYRVPTEAELNDERLSWSSLDSLGAIASPLKLPMNGLRAASIQGEGGRGDYWSATVSGSSSRSLFFSAGALINTNARALGFAVRCIKETAPPTQGSINNLGCTSSTNTGTLSNGSAASGVSSSIPYSGGNGGSHNGQTVNSTGVLGLTAVLMAGTFANGSGNLTYTIIGTPNASGTANFALNIGGASCGLTFPVGTATPPPVPTFPPGYIHCNPSAPTAIVDVANPSTGKVWMDRNLGASQVATSTSDANSYGDLYQWGRGADGHQCRTSSTTNTVSSTDQPTHGSFITTTNAPNDWRSPQNANLWQGENGVNNPCPSGYRLPTEVELNSELASWSSNNAAGAFASPLKLPMGGLRNHDNGSLSFVGSNGLYWSSNVSGTSARSLFFNSSNALPNTRDRAFGRSVRCIKDNASPTQGSINSLGCNNASNTGTLNMSVAANGVSSNVPYTGGDGGAFTPQTVNSTGVLGLTATLTGGSFVVGSGNVTYIITGIPTSSGTAGFHLILGGQQCVLSLPVGTSGPSPGASYPAGYVHCNPASPTEVVDVINPATGKIWMDRNLGAQQAATSSADVDAYGDLFQWGRRADGHQCRNSPTTTTMSSIDQPTHGNYILTSSTPNDWRSPQNDNLWQGVNGTNNPCPIGYRLPTEIEINAERLSWSSSNSAGALASQLKLPMGGSRSHVSGAIFFVGDGGRYWTNIVSTTFIRYLYFNGGGSGTGLNSRANGGSVRCIKN